MNLTELIRLNNRLDELTMRDLQQQSSSESGRLDLILRLNIHTSDHAEKQLTVARRDEFRMTRETIMKVARIDNSGAGSPYTECKKVSLFVLASHLFHFCPCPIVA